MKTLRKSLNGHKDHLHHISTPSSPLPLLSKPIGAIQPPKKVIKALFSHKANSPQELSFEKGDFFHVINDVQQGQWYEAHNPMSGARGLVPSSMFEVFGKGGASPPTPHSQTFTPPAVQAASPVSPKVQAYYAIVLHDFVAERADELDAKSGDTISVVAQSNREWFVAKPIGRLGRPGLIPVSFVEIRDPATGSPVKDVKGLIDSGALPRVEEWKRSVMNYKANSISLGVLDDSSITPQTAQLAPQSKSTPTSQPSINVEGPSPNGYLQMQQPPPDQSVPETSLPDGILLSADVTSFHFEMDEYWFRVHAIFQPYASPSSEPLPFAKQLVLFRSYNDFYDFQVDLLDAFPYEAGRPDVQTRMLPYMPGPAEHVDNEITISRRQELDDYLHQLCELQFSAKYILEHNLVREFLALKPGDAEAEIDPRVADIGALSQSSYPRGGGDDPKAQHDREVRSQLSHLNVADRQDAHSDVSDYEDDADVMGRGYDGDTYDYRTSDHVHPYASPEIMSKPVNPLNVHHHRTESSTSLHKKPPKSASYAVPAHSRSSSRTNSPLPTGRYSSLEIDPYHDNSHSRSSLASSHEPSPVSMRSSQAPSVATSSTSLSGRSRSQSNATMNNPPISATNPQTAFVKIKIFDQASDDLVAIRVHPKVTHSQLMDKVQSRLGGNVLHLRYRDSMNNEYIDLDNDDQLRYWLDQTERHVLYAE